MPRGHEHIPFSIYKRLLGHSFLREKRSFSVLGYYNDRLFPEKYTVKDLISNTKRVQRILLMPPLNRINSIWPPYR